MKKLLVFFLVVGLIGMLIGCGGEKDSKSKEVNNKVIIEDFGFKPEVIEINQGETVVWENKDSMAHNLKADLFTSGNIAKGKTYKYKFEKPGTYEYTCTYFPDMKGKVIVE